MGAYAGWDEVYDMICGRGAYLDTSFSVYPIRPQSDSQKDLELLKANDMLVPELDKELFRKMVKKNGADHILFASDSPWCDQKETYELIDTCLDDEDKKAVYYQNALKLLNLKG